MGLFILRFPHFLILTIVASLVLLEEGGEGHLPLLEGGEVLEGSRLSAHGTAPPQLLRPTMSGEPAKGEAGAAADDGGGAWHQSSPLCRCPCCPRRSPAQQPGVVMVPFRPGTPQQQFGMASQQVVRRG